MTTRSQKKNEVAELVSGTYEASVAENNPPKGLIAGPSKTLSVEPENLDEIEISLRKEIMSELTKILAENQKEMPKLIAKLKETSSKKRPIPLEDRDTDPEPENISVAWTSTPVKLTNATNSKTTPVNSRNNLIQIFSIL